MFQKDLSNKKLYYLHLLGIEWLDLLLKALFRFWENFEYDSKQLGLIFLINLGFTMFFIFLSAGQFSFNIQFSNGTNPFLNYQQEIEVYFYGVFAIFIAFELFMGSWIGYIIVKLYKAAT